jgi:hypothetical protein
MTISVSAFLDASETQSGRTSLLTAASTTDQVTLFTTLVGYQSNALTTGHGSPSVISPSGMSPTLIYDKMLSLLIAAGGSYWSSFVAACTTSQLNQVQAMLPYNSAQRAALLAVL